MATKYKCEKLKSGNIRTCEVRLSYVNLLKPKENKSGALKYSVALLFPEGADISLLEKEVDRVGRERFGAKYDALVKAEKLRLPFKDQGTNLDDDGEVRPGYKAGLVYISASANEDRRPPVVDQDREPLVDMSDVYSGMWARCSIRPFAYDNESRGVAFGIQAVQKIKDDEVLGGGGRVDVDDEFEVIEDEDTDSVFD